MEVRLPFFYGWVYDATGGYRVAFLVAIGCSALSAGTIWVAAPRKVRAVAGRVDRPTQPADPRPTGRD